MGCICVHICISNEILDISYIRYFIFHTLDIYVYLMKYGMLQSMGITKSQTQLSDRTITTTVAILIRLFSYLKIKYCNNCAFNFENVFIMKIFMLIIEEIRKHSLKNNRNLITSYQITTNKVFSTHT